MSNKIKLHLGCGKRYIPGYIHIDVIDYPHVDHITSIDDLSIFEDNSCDEIYSCHVLEHFKRGYVDKVLAEWYRILKPGGLIKVAVPDFEKLIEVYEKYKDLSLIIGPLFGRLDFLYNIHYNVFDFKTLEKSLNKVGFKNVERYDWRETDHSHIDDFSQAYIPHMDKENGINISLNVKGVK